MTTDGGDRFLATPRFDVVLRGYDRRQVDEHLARLQRVIARLRADLEIARSDPGLPPPVTPSRGFAPPSGYPQGQRPQPRPQQRPRPPAPGPDVVGGFTDRMQAILRAAEEEAAEIRRQARASTHGDERLRAQVANLAGERDAVLAELARMRSQLEGLQTSSAAPVAGPASPAAEQAGGAPSYAAEGGRPSTGAVQRPISAQPRPAAGEQRRSAADSPPVPVPVPVPVPRPGRPSPAPRPSRPGTSDQPLPGAPVPGRSPEPQVAGSDLFRPAPSPVGRSGEVERTVAVRAVQPATGQSPVVDRAAGTERQADRSDSDDESAAESASESPDAEATVAVHATPAGREARPEQPDEEQSTADGSAEGSGANGASTANGNNAPSGNGANGNNGASRPTSSYRAG